jgi:hypothetical protein
MARREIAVVSLPASLCHNISEVCLANLYPEKGLILQVITEMIDQVPMRHRLALRCFIP